MHQKVLFFTTLVLLSKWMKLVPTILQNNMHKSNAWNFTIPKEFFDVKANLKFISPSPKQSEPVLGPDSGIQTEFVNMKSTEDALEWTY